MTATYHEGERAVQQRAGVQDAAARVGKMIQPVLSPVMQAFVAAQRLAVIGSVDPSGHVWASPLTGSPGFLRALDARTLSIAAAPVPGDPLAANLVEGAQIGLIALDPATRRRVRVNGRAEQVAAGRWLLRTSEVFSNCQQYIQARDFLRAEETPTPQPVARAPALTAGQRGRIARSDTFFIASFHPADGADASHRGGNPGFVRVLDERTLAFPDYAGNNMFQTLGNLSSYPGVGLLFIDFARGDTLQLTGQARIIWDAARAAEFAGARRVVEVAIEEVIAITGANPLRWNLKEYSPFNP